MADTTGSKPMPHVLKYMTRIPYTVSGDLEISAAMQGMRENQIRHFPVLKNGKLVGVVSDRDIKLAQSLGYKGKLTVEDVMTPFPYVVRPDTRLDEVLLEMAVHKYGCAIVSNKNDDIVGIFTEIDALRGFAETLRLQYLPRAA